MAVLKEAGRHCLAPPPMGLVWPYAWAYGLMAIVICTMALYNSCSYYSCVLRDAGLRIPEARDSKGTAHALC
jgi:hypothetical protein